jgi:SPIRAL1-like protein
MRTETGEVIHANETQAGISTGDVEGGAMRNNYTRAEGQNVGNFLTDRPSSRVLAAPGGGSSIVFGSDGDSAPVQRATGRARVPPPGSLGSADSNFATNNYARPDGQNVGNFLTDRKAVKVHAPPGGASQITFG